MSIRKHVSCLVLVSTSIGCQAGPETLSYQEKAAIADTVESVVTEWFGAMLALDSIGYSERFAEDMIMAGDEGHLNTDAAQFIADSREAVMRIWRATGEISVDDVEVLSRDAAVVIWHANLQILFHDSRRLEKQSLTTAVWAKRDGVWKIIRQHESIIPPAP